MLLTEDQLMLWLGLGPFEWKNIEDEDNDDDEDDEE